MKEAKRRRGSKPRVQTSAISNDAIRRESIGGKLTWESLNRYAGRPASARISARWKKALDDGAAAIADATKMKAADARAAMSRQAPMIASATRLYLHEMKFRGRERRQLKDWLVGSRGVPGSLIEALKDLERMVKELESGLANPPDAWTSSFEATSIEPPAPRSLRAILEGTKKRRPREIEELLADATELLRLSGKQPWIRYKFRWEQAVDDGLGGLPRAGGPAKLEQWNYIRRLGAVWERVTKSPLTYSGNQPPPPMYFLYACFALLPDERLRPKDNQIRVVVAQAKATARRGAEIPLAASRRKPRHN